MSLEDTVYNTVTEAISAPVISKFITGASEDESGLTKKELTELAKTLPSKLSKFKQKEVMDALDAILLNPAKGIKGKKSEVHQIILDEIHSIVK